MIDDWLDSSQYFAYGIIIETTFFILSLNCFRLSLKMPLRIRVINEGTMSLIYKNPHRYAMNSQGNANRVIPSTFVDGRELIRDCCERVRKLTRPLYSSTMLNTSQDRDAVRKCQITLYKNHFWPTSINGSYMKTCMVDINLQFQTKRYKILPVHWWNILSCFVFFCFLATTFFSESGCWFW